MGRRDKRRKKAKLRERRREKEALERTRERIERLEPVIRKALLEGDWPGFEYQD